MTYDTDPYHIAGPEHDPARPGQTPLETQGNRTPEGLLASRCYGGFVASEFKERALDLDAMDEGRKRPGMAERLRACLTNIVTRFTAAMDAYMKVRRALGTLTAEPEWPAPSRHSAKPRKLWMWRRPPLSNRQWQQLDAAHRFDVRGTSPEFLARRVRAIRAKRRLVAESDFFKATKPKAREHAPLIGPPVPREHKGVKDLFMIWPPVGPAELEALIANVPVEALAPGPQDTHAVPDPADIAACIRNSDFTRPVKPGELSFKQLLENIHTDPQAAAYMAALIARRKPARQRESTPDICESAWPARGRDP